MELILDVDGHHQKVDGRVATIVMWLLHRLDRVTAPDRVQIVFNCAGQDVSAEIKEHERINPALLR